MNVLLSIRPEYVSAILSGRKKYEFRKRKPRLRSEGQKAYIYTTAPVRKIVAAFTIGSILENHPRRLWRQLQNVAGVDYRKYFEYFGSRETGFAIEIDSLRAFDPPIEPRVLFSNFSAPQSFRYIPESWETSLSKERGVREKLSVAHETD